MPGKILSFRIYFPISNWIQNGLFWQVKLTMLKNIEKLCSCYGDSVCVITSVNTNHNLKIQAFPTSLPGVTSMGVGGQ